MDTHPPRTMPCFLFFLSFWSLGLESASVVAQATLSKESILAEFYPYRQGSPQVEGITPGMTITASNVQVAEPVLPPEILKAIQAGDFEITIQVTTDVPIREEYIAATVEHADKVTLGTDSLLQHYIAGLPFPVVNPTDPQAGLKLGWNLRYRDRADISQSWGTTSLLNDTGGVIRSSSSLYMRMYGMHRPNAAHNISEWADKGILYKDYSMTFRPTDSEGTQTMGIRHNQDTLGDDRWLYDPKTRRTRKLVYNPYDAFQGLTFLSEEFSGFDGHVSAYDWQYIETKLILAPGIVKREAVQLGGKCGCYPIDPWELRWVHVVDAVPRVPNHPYGRRRLYVDRQHYSPLVSVIFDKDGHHWRTFFFSFGHPEFNSHSRGIRVPMFVGNSWVDYKAERATIWIPSRNIYNRPLPVHSFTVGAMMRQGK